MQSKGLCLPIMWILNHSRCIESRVMEDLSYFMSYSGCRFYKGHEFDRWIRRYFGVVLILVLRINKRNANHARATTSFFDSLTQSQWSSSGNPVAIECARNLDPSVHWNATGERIVGSQCASSGLPVAFQWPSSMFQLCKLTLERHRDTTGC